MIERFTYITKRTAKRKIDKNQTQSSEVMHDIGGHDTDGRDITVTYGRSKESPRGEPCVESKVARKRSAAEQGS
jgi:hypothetical protein